MGAQKTLYFVTEVAPITFDPTKAFDLVSRNVAANLFEGLVVLDSVTLQVRPGTAERWEMSADGRTCTFYLRQSARFSTGEPITAEDVVHTFSRIKESVGESLTVKAINAGTVQIKSDEPMTNLLARLTNPACGIVSHKATDDSAQASINSGPFVLKGTIGNDPVRRVIVLERNPHYWNADAVVIGRIVMISEPNSDERLRLYEARKATGGTRLPFIVHHAPPSHFSQLRQQPDLRQYPVLGTICFSVNTAKRPLNDPLVRKALALALNRSKIVTDVAPHVKEATSLLPQHAPYQTVPGESLYNPSRAKKLMAAAGYPGGKGFPELNVVIFDYKYQVEMAQRFSEDLQSQLGIKIHVEAVDWPQYLSRVSEQKFDLLYETWHMAYPDAGAFLQSLTSGHPFNTPAYVNPGYDSLVAEAEHETDVAMRAKLLQAAEQTALADMPLIPLFYRTHLSLVDASIKGFQEGPTGIIPFGEISVESATADAAWPSDLASLHQALTGIAAGSQGVTGDFTTVLNPSQGPKRFTQSVTSRVMSQW